MAVPYRTETLWQPLICLKFRTISLTEKGKSLRVVLSQNANLTLFPQVNRVRRDIRENTLILMFPKRPEDN
ncbi:hypothetical protein HYC85_028960 [Camellia sinensis]|uniref:Uncharacterized protein n=1 Tax=Camellia sinensis TaxID=4442 RepID=A0A7J7FWV9_CAMSI|nr:hypothetical protein HYC85_028960 [Camellia sinensis]